MNRNERRLSWAGFWVVLMVGTMAGCGPEALPPTQHAPLSPDQVKIYPKAPARYEKMSMITVPVTPQIRWDEKGESTPGFEAMKSQAAAMGANGVLLAPEPGTYDLMVTVGYKGTWYQVPAKRDPKAVVARAIYVVQE